MTPLQRPGPSTPAAGARGVDLLNRPALNTGTAFPEDSGAGSAGTGCRRTSRPWPSRWRASEAHRRKDGDLERQIDLRALRDTDEVLFYRLLLDQFEEMFPIIDTPVVAHACEQFSPIYRRPRGLVIRWPLPAVADRACDTGACPVPEFPSS